MKRRLLLVSALSLTKPLASFTPSLVLDLFNKHPLSQFGNPMYVLKTQNSANLKKTVLEEKVHL